jgi:hypothetical protein
MKRLVLAVLVLAMLAAPVGAELFKWTDENGVVHWSNTVPEGYGKTYHESDRAATSSEKPPGRPRSGSSPNPAAAISRHRAEQDVRAHAASMYPDDYDMQLFTIEKYMDAYDALAATPVNAGSAAAMRRALERYYPDFDMAMFAYNKQVEAYNKLHGLD